MKALNISSMSPDKRQEAHDLAKAALKEDMQSHMCWHVYGILHRTDRNYEQAAKCYMNALKRDPENMHICKDLSNIQMQIRDIKGLVDTAQKMLGLRANQRPTWMLLAIAHHLDKNYDTAAEVRPAAAPRPQHHHASPCCPCAFQNRHSSSDHIAVGDPLRQQTRPA